MSIRYLHNNEIDHKAWDNCVASAFHSSIFAFSWYLDLVCDHWEALVEDDYLSVMPLPVYRKLGIYMILRPYFLNESGIFSITPITQEKTLQFIDAIPLHFKYYRIALNKYNPLEAKQLNCNTYTNYEIDLIKPFPKLKAGYSQGLAKRLEMASSDHLSFIAGLSHNALFEFILEKKIRIPRVIRMRDFRLFKLVTAGLTRYKSGELYGVYDRYNELISVACFGWYNNQIHLIFHLNDPGLVENHAASFMIDRFVNKFAETSSTLIFSPGAPSGSFVDYAGFGAHATNHKEILSNKFSFPLNLCIHYLTSSTFIESSQLSKS